MIDHLDELLRELFVKQIFKKQNDKIKNYDDQVGFQPPDQKWSDFVKGLNKMALNVYLVDLRENRKLRSNRRIRHLEHMQITEKPAPQRIDCHYLITAWSPAIDSQAVEATADEQALLYEVVGVLMNNGPLVPKKVYAPDKLPPKFPDALAKEELPATILPVEGFPKLAEFWGTMGAEQRWKPVVYLVVTLPVILRKEIAGPMVTTRITEYRQEGKKETAVEWIQIAGTVTNPAGKPVSGAWVGLEPGGNSVISDDDGRITFTRLQSGSYTLSVRASGFAELREAIEVPSPGGGYDVQLK